MAKIKISGYAKLMGISHKTAWRWYRSGVISGEVIGPRNIFIDVEAAPQNTLQNSGTQNNPVVYIYCRVSTSRDRENLNRQVERVKEYCRGKGHQIAQVVADASRRIYPVNIGLYRQCPN